MADRPADRGGLTDLVGRLRGHGLAGRPLFIGGLHVRQQRQHVLAQVTLPIAHPRQDVVRESVELGTERRFEPDDRQPYPGQDPVAALQGRVE